MSQRRLILPLVLQLSLTGCAVAAPFAAEVPGSAAAVAAARRIVVRIAPRAFGLLQASQVEGHLATEVQAYRIYLRVRGDDGYDAVSDQVVSAVGASVATFSGLDPAWVYQIAVKAYSNADGVTGPIGDFEAISEDVDLSTAAAGQDALVTVKPDLDMRFSGQASLGLSSAVTAGSSCFAQSESTLVSAATVTSTGSSVITSGSSSYMTTSMVTMTYPVYEYHGQATCTTSTSSGSSSYLTAYTINTTFRQTQFTDSALPAGGGYEVAFGAYGA